MTTRQKRTALPTEVNATDGVVAGDGTVVFEDNGNDAHAAAQALEDGSVEVTETIADGVSATIGLIDAPWAIDANGAHVPTHYTVDGNSLTQHVDHSAEYAYPMTADPSISFGWVVYLKYSKSEVRTVTTGLGGAINDKAKFAFVLCARIPHPAAAAGCALVGSNYHSSIYSTFKSAKANNQCVEIQLAWISYLPVVWKRYSC